MLAHHLKSAGYSVFYDKDESAELWGKNLVDSFLSVYKDKASYCVMFLSKHYGRKAWPKHERQSALARALEESREYILPVRLDDAEIPGILPTTAFLDLQSMEMSAGVKKVHEQLLKKLGKTSGSGLEANLGDAHSEFVLLYATDKQLHFVPLQNARWSSTEISLVLRPHSSEDRAFLASLREPLKNQFHQVHQTNLLAVACQENAAWVRVRSVSQEIQGSDTVWKTALTEEDKRHTFHLGDITYNGVSPDQIAEMRARRILLNERKVPKHQFGQLGPDSLAEALIRGSDPSDPMALAIVESPIPEIYRSCGRSPDTFKKFSLLAVVLYLKLSNTVEHILRLDLDPLDTKGLGVSFQGRRRKQYDNEEPAILVVNGVCPL